MEEFGQHIINGLSLGSIYALVALFYTIFYIILKLINFAHGDVYMVGAFAGYYFARGMGLDQEPSVLGGLSVLFFSMVVCAFLGYGIERFAYRPLRKSPGLNVLITAIGVSLFLENFGQLIFGADPKFFPQIIPSKIVIDASGIRITNLQIMTLVVSLGLMAGLQYIVFKTRFGAAMRAVSFNKDVASLMGIPTNTVISSTFMLGSALAAAAGVLVGITYPRIDPLMGLLPGLKAFVAAVIGGIGNVPGAVIGGLFMGVAEEMVTGYGSSTYRDALAFGILIVMLLIKPTGLFGKKEGEKV